MSVDYFLRTWKVTKGDNSVEKGQRIKIQRKSGGSGDLEFVVPPAVHNGKSGFGDGGWAAVNNLRYVGGGTYGTVTGTAVVGGKTNTITISGFTSGGEKHIKCTVASQDLLIQLPKAKHLVAKVYRLLRSLEDEFSGTALLRVVRLLSELGTSLEEVGEWEAEDDGG